MTEIQYLWEHWKFNADQRIKAFNFFVVFAIFSNGGVFTALEKQAHPGVLLAIGLLIVVLVAVFWMIDVRSERLIRLAEPGFRLFEQTLDPVARVFYVDAAKYRGSWIRYKYAFRTLFLAQLLFALCVCGFASAWWWGEKHPRLFGEAQARCCSANQAK